MLRHHQALDHVLMLLRYHRPGLDHLPTGERANLVADACAHTNARLEALRKLVAYLEHGRLNYRGPATIKVAGRDIKAAVLRDVDGLSNRRIAEVLCMNLPADFLIRGIIRPCARWSDVAGAPWWPPSKKRVGEIRRKL